MRFNDLVSRNKDEKKLTLGKVSQVALELPFPVISVNQLAFSICETQEMSFVVAWGKSNARMNCHVVTPSVRTFSLPVFRSCFLLSQHNLVQL